MGDATIAANMRAAYWDVYEERRDPQTGKWSDNAPEAWQAALNAVKSHLAPDPLAARRAIAERVREAAAQELHEYTELPDCDMSSYDNSTGAWECSLEARGHDCLCADRVEQAEKYAAKIRAMPITDDMLT